MIHLGAYYEISTKFLLKMRVCGSRRPQLQMAEFQAALEKNGLFELDGEIKTILRAIDSRILHLQKKD